MHAVYAPLDPIAYTACIPREQNRDQKPMKP